MNELKKDNKDMLSEQTNKGTTQDSYKEIANEINNEMHKKITQYIQ